MHQMQTAQGLGSKAALTFTGGCMSCLPTSLQITWKFDAIYTNTVYMVSSIVPVRTGRLFRKDARAAATISER
jgi:hypothetical protein